MLGEQIDPSIHVKLFDGVTANSEKLPKNNLRVKFDKVSSGPSEDESEPLFSDIRDYTFRYYGKVKDFTWYDEETLVTTRSHLEYMKNSPKLSINHIDEEVLAGRVYGITLIDLESANRVNSRLTRLDDIDNWSFLYRYGSPESVSDIEKFLNMIAGADVIALHTRVGHEVDYVHDIILLVDDNTKIFLDKLMTIYNRNMRKYFSKHNITLGMVLDNLDLYHCLSYGV